MNTVEQLKQELIDMAEHACNLSEPARLNGGVTVNSLAIEAETKLNSYVSALLSVQNKLGVPAFAAHALEIVNDEKGAYLFDATFNGRAVSVFITTNGEFVQADKPVTQQSRLRVITKRAIVDCYGAEKCCEAIINAARALKEHYKNVETSNRAAIGLAPLNH